jgi:hypothetical protein
MAITSVGYDGTIGETEWAKLASFIGTPYAVAGTADYATAINVSADRTVTVSAGTAYGHGVYDVNSAPVNVQCDTIVSGSRWDLICIRRNWVPAGGTTTVIKVNGNASRIVPSGRSQTPGVQDDQPIALVQITAGSTLPTAVVDLRVFASKVLTVNDLIALPTPALGVEAVVGGIRYRRDLDSTGSAAWLQQNKVPVYHGVYDAVADVSIANSHWYSPGFTDSLAGGVNTFGTDITRTERVFTVRQPGVYSLHACFGWKISVDGYRQAVIRLNPTSNTNPAYAGGVDTEALTGSPIAQTSSFPPAIMQSYDLHTVEVSATVKLAANDKFAFYTRQLSGAALALQFEPYFTNCTITRLGDA